MLEKISSVKGLEFYIRLAVIFLAVLSPFIFLFTQGIQSSISNYWNTPLQPLFIFANATTSYYLFRIDSWKPSAVFLLALTAFSVEHYEITHNILAVSFFVVSLYSLYKSRHFRFCFWIYLSSLLIMAFDLLAGEVVAVLALCTYHGLILNRVRKWNSNGKKVQSKTKS